MTPAGNMRIFHGLFYRHTLMTSPGGSQVILCVPKFMPWRAGSIWLRGENEWHEIDLETLKDLINDHE